MQRKSPKTKSASEPGDKERWIITAQRHEEISWNPELKRGRNSAALILMLFVFPLQEYSGGRRGVQLPAGCCVTLWSYTDFHEALKRRRKGKGGGGGLQTDPYAPPPPIPTRINKTWI